MKKYFSALLALTVFAGIYGCGDNKTKEKLLGTAVVNSTSATGGSFTSNPDAASMTALYKVSFMGAGAGSFSYSASRRYGAPASAQRVPSGEEGLGLGIPNAQGEYIIADPLGMTVRLKFQKSNETVYLDFAKTFTAGGLYLYTSQNLAGSKIALSGNVDPNEIANAFMSGSGHLWIPSAWIKVGGQPLNWYDVTYERLEVERLSGLETWMFANFPDTMVNTVSGSIPGGTMSLIMTAAMPSVRPSDANPATMTGSGTVTFDTGEVWAITASMNAGESGPIGGTITFSSTSGESGTLTFHSDCSMDGVMKKGTTTIGTIHINADGTGTYTDVESGKTFSITDAKPK